MKPCTFEEAVHLYERLIKSQMKKLGIYRDHEDYYQCGLVALWRAYEQFEEEKGSFPAYALQTVRGYLLVQLEREKRFETRHTKLDQELVERIMYEEKEDSFDLYIEQLNEQQRYVMTERFCYGKKLIEIAAQMNVTYDSARHSYRSALEKLRRMKEHL
ncbi:sigma-70 family RNA polymerase sigma factor [Microbacteriaceae bacterium 4G12]